MNRSKTIFRMGLVAALCATGAQAEDLTTALALTGQSSEENNRVHKTEIPWFVWYKSKASSFNVTGGSFAEIEAYPFYLSQTTFNDREVSTVNSGGELDKMLLTTSEFSQLGAGSQYLQWLSPKSHGSEKIENIVAGHINIAVQKPLDAMPGLHVNGAGSYNQNADAVYGTDGVGGQAGVSYAEQLFDDTLGVIFLSSYENAPLANKESKAWYAPDYDELRAANYGWQQGGLYGPSGYSGGTDGGSDEYLRNYLGLQWRPSSSFEASYDILYSQLNTESRQSNYEIADINRDNNGDSRFSPLLPLAVTEAFQGEYSNSAMRPGSMAGLYEGDERLLNTGLGLKYENKLWTVSADLDYSLSQSDTDWKGMKTVHTSAGPEIVTLPGDGSFGFNKDLLDLGENRMGDLQHSKSDIEDELGALSVDFTRILDAWLLDSVDFGMRGTDRSRTARYLSATSLPGTNTFGNAVMGAAQADGINYLILDIDRLIANNYGGGPPSSSFVLDTGAPFIGSGNVDENTVAGYAKFNFSRKLGSRFSLLGNAGMRVVSVQTESDGTMVNYAGGALGTPQDVSGENDYTGVLPSLNLTLFPKGGKYAVGFGASRRIAKAPLDMLSASTKIYDAWPGANSGVTKNHGEGGNPELDPWEVNQFDLSFDWHFMDFAYISTVASYKDLDTYIAQGVRDESISGSTYSVVRPVNRHGDSIQSLSLSYNQPFAFIPKEWGEAGLYLSGVVSDSDATEDARNPMAGAGEDATGQSYSLVGLAKLSTVSAIYYGLGDWDLVLRHRYRSEHTTKIDGKYLATAEPLGTFDLRVSYSPTPRVAILCEAKNLTGEDYSYYFEHDKRRPGQTISWGQSYVVGVNYTF